jgi:gamma-glutamyl phosphate reductase
MTGRFQKTDKAPTPYDHIPEAPTETQEQILEKQIAELIVERKTLTEANKALVDTNTDLQASNLRLQESDTLLRQISSDIKKVIALPTE